MRPIKSLLLTAMLAALAFTPACTTVTTPTGGTVTKVDPAKVATVVSAMVPIGVQVAVGADTNSAAYFRASSIAVRAAVTAGLYDPVALQATLDAISIKELRTPEARVTVEAALAIYKAFAGDAVAQKLADSGYAQVLTALADAIDAGLTRLPIVLGTK